MLEKNTEKIDFVITWVDGNDPEWQEDKKKYKPTMYDDDRVERFRDWNNLKYLFRGIDRFAPWVNNVFLVTYGHIPKWLNEESVKIIKHSDILPTDALPVFNGSPIEVNLHRIPGLSEEFVYFNDDMFLLKPVRPKDFFYKGLPCDSAALSVHCYSEETWFHMAAFRHVGIMNKYFVMKDVIRNNFFKWFNPKYGMKNFQTLILLRCPRFPGFWPDHMPQSFLKSTFEELWKLEEEKLNEVTYHRFRTQLELHQWLFKDWQLCKGSFYPRSVKTGKAFELRHGIEPSIKAADFIRNQKRKMICLNDGRLTEEEFEESKKNVNSAFALIFPDKSKYEK